MTLPPLPSVKKRRMILGITQKQLADLCGISQSVIAKLESGDVDPSYSTAVKIFETLERFEAKETDTLNILNREANMIMTTKIISVLPTDQAAKAQALITNSKDISQLPVIDSKGQAVGALTELQLLSDSISKETLVKDIMREPFPVVSPRTNLATVRNILLGEQAVLVSDGKTIVGIITKYDFITALRTH